MPRFIPLKKTNTQQTEKQIFKSKQVILKTQKTLSK